MPSFWIVMKDKSEAYVSKRHETFESAKAEAERLCRKEGVRFYVLEMVGSMQPQQQPVVWVSKYLV